MPLFLNTMQLWSHKSSITKFGCITLDLKRKNEQISQANFDAIELMKWNWNAHRSNQ